MNMSFEDQIRERAYHIWLADGMTDGHAHEHWVCAEQAMRGEIAELSAEPEIILTKAPVRKAAAKTAKTVTTKKAASKKAASKKAVPEPVAKAAVAKAPRATGTKKVELRALN